MPSGNGINTLEYVHKLEKAGIPREHTEALASVFYEVINSNLATKRDIEEVKRDIEEVKRDIETVKAELKKDMVIIMGSYVLVILGAFATMAKLGILVPL